MTTLRDFQWYLHLVESGQVPGASIVNKFGRNAAVPNGSIKPIAIGGVWKAGITVETLEIVSDNVNDTAAGTGGRSVMVEGLTTGFVAASEEVALNGTTPVALVNSYIRVLRMYIVDSGTYGSSTASSHNGIITLQETGAGTPWIQIDTAVTSFGVGQSQLAAMTIPAGYTGYVLSKSFSVDSSKSARIYFFVRENADIVSTPFSSMLLKEQHDGVTGFSTLTTKAGLLVLPEKSDCGFMAYGDGAVCSVSAEFQILLEAN